MKEVVILVGMQGAGKTHYCRAVLADYTRVSQDEGPRRFPGVLRHVRDLLEGGTKRIVIDRTNPLRRQREAFARLAREFDCRVRIIHFDVPRDVCEARILSRTDHPTLGPDRMREAIDRYVHGLDVPAEDECEELVVLGADHEPA